MTKLKNYLNRRLNPPFTKGIILLPFSKGISSTDECWDREILLTKPYFKNKIWQYYKYTTIPSATKVQQIKVGLKNFPDFFDKIEKLFKPQVSIAFRRLGGNAAVRRVKAPPLLEHKAPTPKRGRRFYGATGRT